MDFRPYSKEYQLRGHQKQKDKPKLKEKRPKKKRKKLETFKGRVIPSKKTRGMISKTEYEKAAENHGMNCFFCGTTQNLECHHVVPKGYSRVKNGRGQWRNLRFLCTEHHRGKSGVHQDQEKMQQLQEFHEELYGPYFWCDRFDLFKMNLIPNVTKEAFEEFMEKGFAEIGEEM